MEYTPKSRGLTDKKMFIGELSSISGFSKDTLRYYEKIDITKGVGLRRIIHTGNTGMRHKDIGGGTVQMMRRPSLRRFMLCEKLH